MFWDLRVWYLIVGGGRYFGLDRDLLNFSGCDYYLFYGVCVMVVACGEYCCLFKFAVLLFLRLLVVLIVSECCILLCCFVYALFWFAGWLLVVALFVVYLEFLTCCAVLVAWIYVLYDYDITWFVLFRCMLIFCFGDVYLRLFSGLLWLFVIRLFVVTLG